MTAPTHPTPPSGSPAADRWTDVLRIVKWLAGALVPALIIWIAVRQIANVAIIVKTVTVPATLGRLSASELTHRLADAIDSVKFDARPSLGQRRYAIDSDIKVPDVEVPMTQTTLPKLVALVRNVLGRDTRELTWEISGHPAAKNPWVLTAHLQGHAVHQASFDPSDPGPALSVIAQGVLGDVEPLILARALLYDGNCDDARAVAQRLLRREFRAGPEQSDALNFIGFASECEDRDWGPNTSEAVRHYRDAAMQDPSSGLPHANLGRMFAIQARSVRDTSMRRRYRDSMEREFTIADGLTRNHPGVHEAWGWGLLAAGRPDAALHHFDEAIRLEPRLATAYFLRADAHHQLSDFPAAVADYARGLVRAPRDTQHIKAYGQELIFAGDWRGAAGAFARAARLDTTDYDARYYLGCSLRHIDSASAATVLEPVITRMGPDSPYTRYAHLVIASDTVDCQ
jgi:tetratricopeptide (TPR) repeat protein